jgi:hypothetical protein
LNSGLLVLSKYPVTKQHFLNYQDHQSLVDADALSNKGDEISFGPLDVKT